MNLIIGCGNELMGDDWIGLYIVQELAKEDLPDWELSCAGTKGFNLLWDLLGNQNVVIIDAVLSGNKPGTIYKLGMEEFLNLTHEPSPSGHTLNWKEIINLGKFLYPTLFPKKILFFLIEADSFQPVYKRLSPAITPHLKQILNTIKRVLRRIM
ncbi:MAG: hydrogenase maturation protease [Bacillota bacterium]